jgi:hypothetical protein
MKKLHSMLLLIPLLLLGFHSVSGQSAEFRISKVQGDNFIVDVGSAGGVVKNGTYAILRGNEVVGTAESRIVKSNVSGFKVTSLTPGMNPVRGDRVVLEQRSQEEQLFSELDQTEEPVALVAPPAAAPAATYQSDMPKKNRTESWYFYFGIGGASIYYPDDIQTVLDAVEGQPGVSHLSLSLDLLGFYWHVSPTSILGVAINGVGDRYEAAGEYFQINQYTYGVSSMHYLMKNFGSGLFVRADAGFSKLVLQSSITSTEASDTGLGILLGTGWSFDLGGTRLLLNLNYGYRRVEGESAGALSVSLGGLF